MRTLDLKTDLKYLYHPSAKQVEVVLVPRLQFAMVDGALQVGERPGTSAGFTEAVAALYGVSYTLKFTFKKRSTDPIDYPVMPLEGLWWVEDGIFDIKVMDNWRYTLMILQPDVVTPDLFDQAVAAARAKRGDSPALSKLRLEPFEEGLSMQVMHVGPYATEPATMERMAAFALEHGYLDLVGSAGGKHHEIYLGDPNRADQARLKTILRHPVRAAEIAEATTPAA